MDFTLDLPIYDSILEEFMDLTKFKQGCYELRELTEMCCYTDEVQQYFDEHYLMEALNDINQDVKTNIGNALKATKNTTTGMVKAHSALTTSLGNAMSSSYNLLYKLVMAIIKVISFLFNSFAILPKMLLKLVTKVGEIPADISTKINGDIQLYVTAEDLYTIYNHSIMKKLDEFLSTAQAMTKGELWGSKLHMKDKDVDGKKIEASENDRKLAASLNRQANALEIISFNKSIIKLKDDTTRKTYFSKSMVFTDAKGQKHEGGYYKLLSQLVEDMVNQKSKLEAVHSALGEKYQKTLNNQTWAKLSPITQDTISRSIQAVSKVVNLVGALTRDIQADVNTMNTAIDKALEASKKK